MFALLVLLPTAVGFTLLAAGTRRLGFGIFEVVFALLIWFFVDELRDPRALFSRGLPLLGPLPSEAALSWLLRGIRVGVALFVLCDAAIFLTILFRVFVG